MQDRPARRQRVGSRAGGSGDDQSVGAQHVDELSVDAHLELDQSAIGALADAGVVERQHVEYPGAGTVHLGGEQHARLGDEVTIEHGADGLEHGVDGDVGEETKPPLIDAHQCDVEWGERARDVEHRAVAADDDRQIGDAPDFIQRQNFEVIAYDVSRGERIQQHAHAAALEKARKLRAAARRSRGLLYLPINAMVLNAGHHAGIKT